ncbi:hypothetical protein BH11BAC7_BH11BAC7_10850 [soil metagenome]
MNEEMTEKERLLWKQAKKRVEFKRHLWTYLIVNLFLWIVWAMTGMEFDHREFVPWPVWSTVGWGIGLAFSYFGAYHGTTVNAVDKEYEKMKNK